MKKLYLHELVEGRKYEHNTQRYKVIGGILYKSLDFTDQWDLAICYIDMEFTEIHEPITFAYIKDNCKIGITRFKVAGIWCDFVGWHRGKIVIYIGREFSGYCENNIKEWEIMK